MRSARCSIRIKVKWPVASCSSFFCLSTAIMNQQWNEREGGACGGDSPGSPTIDSFAAPLVALVLALFDILGCGDGDSAEKDEIFIYFLSFGRVWCGAGGTVCREVDFSVVKEGRKLGFRQGPATTTMTFGRHRLCAADLHWPVRYPIPQFPP